VDAAYTLTLDQLRSMFIVRTDYGPDLSILDDSMLPVKVDGVLYWLPLIRSIIGRANILTVLARNLAPPESFKSEGEYMTTREKWARILPTIQAFVAGEKIQKLDYNKKWQDTDEMSSLLYETYRVRPARV